MAAVCLRVGRRRGRRAADPCVCFRAMVGDLHIYGGQLMVIVTFLIVCIEWEPKQHTG